LKRIPSFIKGALTLLFRRGGMPLLLKGERAPFLKKEDTLFFEEGALLL